MLRLCVDISAKALVDRPSYALKILEHILMVQIPDHPEYSAYSESVRELYNMATYEIRRLAIRYADYFAVSGSLFTLTKFTYLHIRITTSRWNKKRRKLGKGPMMRDVLIWSYLRSS